MRFSQSKTGISGRFLKTISSFKTLIEWFLLVWVNFIKVFVCIWMTHLCQEEVDDFLFILSHFLFWNILLWETRYLLGNLTLTLLKGKRRKNIEMRHNSQTSEPWSLKTACFSALTILKLSISTRNIHKCSNWAGNCSEYVGTIVLVLIKNNL